MTTRRDDDASGAPLHLGAVGHDPSAPGGPRVVRLPRARRTVGLLAVAAVTAALCSGAAPLLPTGADRLELVAADQQLDRSPAPARRAEVSRVPLGRQLTAVARTPAAAVAVALPAPVVTPEASALAANGVPDAALAAYRRAAASMAVADPGCRIDWSLLAAIGRVESNHGQFGGRTPTADGAVQPPILGLVLDGRPGTSAIRDTDGGALDGDPVFDRAVGPMQFIPGTWARWGADGDADGVVDPHDLDDAALGAARYLCAGDRDLSTVEGRAAAVFSYNHSEAYVALVTAIAAAYAAGVPFTGVPPAAVPVPTGPVEGAGDPASVSPPVAPPTDTPADPAPPSEPAPPTDPPSAPPTDEPTPDPSCTSPSPSPSTSGTGPGAGPTPTDPTSTGPTPAEPTPTDPDPTCPGTAPPPTGTPTAPPTATEPPPAPSP